MDEHLSSQTGLLLAPCAWCEITNISLKTASLLNRKCEVTEAHTAAETEPHQASSMVSTHPAAHCRFWLIL